jgi:hypothetical protein
VKGSEPGPALMTAFSINWRSFKMRTSRSASSGVRGALRVIDKAKSRSSSSRRRLDPRAGSGKPSRSHSATVRRAALRFDSPVERPDKYFRVWGL